MRLLLRPAAVAATLMALTLTLHPSAMAAPSDGSATAAVPSARAVDLSHRLVVAIRITDQLHALLKSMMPAMVDREARAFPDFKPEWRQAMTDATIAAMDDIMPGYLKDAEVLYAKTFSEEELAQAVAFYESPTGRSMVAKSPSLAPALTKSMVSRMDGLEADIKARFCAKTDTCKPTAASARPTGA